MTTQSDTAPDSGPRDSRPVIQILVGKPPVLPALAALRSDPNLFVRDVDLVFVTRATAEDSENELDAIPAGTPKIHTMEHETLWLRMCQCARWEREKATQNGPVIVPTEPGERFVKAVLKHKQFPGLRRLAGVVETPFPRPDGSICQEPGYDQVTHYLYEPSCRFPLVEDHPDSNAGCRAYANLRDLFIDFPFSTEAGRAGAVCAAATLICRPAVRGPVPAFVMDATARGTGKTLLADVCAGVATGRDAGRNHFPFATGINMDTELAKVLATIARRGAALVNFDNVDEARVGGDVLEECISARDEYTFRILGKTEGLSLPWRTVVFVTANNADWTRGMDRRILHLRMESPLERPEHRPLDTYVHPKRAGVLFEYAVEHRAEYVHDVLTLVRAYCVAGRPDPLTVGTFESWAGLLPSAIRWASGVDPLDCRPSQSGEESQDATYTRIFVQQWSAFCRSSGVDSVSAAQIVTALYPKGEPPAGWDDFRAAVEFFVPVRPGQPPSASALAAVIGRRFRGAATRTADAPAPLQRFRPDGLTHGRQRWKVEDVTAANYAAPRDPDDPESY